MIKKIRNFIIEKTHNGDIEEYRRYVLVMLFFVVSMVFLSVMGIIALEQNNIALAIADFVTVLVLAVFVLLLRKNTDRIIYYDIMIIIMGLFFLFLFVMGGVDQSAHVWCYTFPLIASFIVSYKKGFIYSIVLMLFLMASQVSVHLGEMQFITAYNTNFLIRFFAAYAIIIFVACIAEWARAITYLRMVLFHKNMKETIDQLEETRAKLRTLTNIDPLTKIYNKRFLSASTKVLLGSSDEKYVASMFFDIDDFKKYNDSYGHISGDEVLINVVQTIKNRVEQNGGILVRFGGEEIVCLVKTDDLNRVEKIAKQIIYDFASKRIENKHTKIGYITVSIGIAYCLKKEWVGWEPVVKKSDRAMYLAKERGKNTYCIS